MHVVRRLRGRVGEYCTWHNGYGLHRVDQEELPPDRPNRIAGSTESARKLIKRSAIDAMRLMRAAALMPVIFYLRSIGGRPKPYLKPPFDLILASFWQVKREICSSSGRVARKPPRPFPF